MIIILNENDLAQAIHQTNVTTENNNIVFTAALSDSKDSNFTADQVCVMDAVAGVVYDLIGGDFNNLHELGIQVNYPIVTIPMTLVEKELILVNKLVECSMYTDVTPLSKLNKNTTSSITPVYWDDIGGLDKYVICFFIYI